MLASAAHALYFFIDAATPRCFFEDLPKDTLVVGHYGAEEWDDRANSWQQHAGISIYISVDELFGTHLRPVSQKGSSSGKFRFTPNSSSGRSGWLSTSSPNGGIKLQLDLVIGETNEIESTDKNKLQDIATRVKDLNARLKDVRREQVFQREREAEFRDQSESTNSRVIRWILIQLVVMGITCVWQLSNLRSFFIKQKLT